MIWAVLQRERPMSAYVAATDYELNRRRFYEHASDRIRNDAAENNWDKWAGKRGRLPWQSDRVTSEGALSGAITHWKGWVRRLRGGRILGTAGCCSQNGTYHRQSRCKTICAAQSHFCEGKVVWAQSCKDGHRRTG